MNPALSTPNPELLARYKQEAAERAVDFVGSGMAVGLGTGSTAIFATRRLGLLVAQGKLHEITGFATSKVTADEARRVGIPMITEELPRDLDLTIDGADEVDPELNLIKGGGGALTREKIVAQASRRVIIVVDETKLSPRLGTHWSVPIEVLAFGWRSQMRFLESLGGIATVRRNPDGSQWMTDSGNMILDTRFGPIDDARALAAELGARAGIVEHGLFLNLATDLIVGESAGTRHVARKK
jgi:ribose 5-phosphate isomerase A